MQETTTMTKAEIQAWRDRWKLMNELDVEDLRQTPMDIKLKQLAALMASVDVFHARESLEADDQIGYDRWRKFRTAYGRRKSLRS